MKGKGLIETSQETYDRTLNSVLFIEYDKIQMKKLNTAGNYIWG